MKIRKMFNIIIIWLTGFSILSTILILSLLNASYDDSRIVNYAGVVRGGSQRITAIHMMGKPVDELVEQLEQIMDALIEGDETLQLQPFKSKVYQEHMNNIRDYWYSDLRAQMIHEPGKHNPEALYQKSQYFFDLTNQAVAVAEQEASSRIMKIIGITCAFLLVNLSAVITIRNVVKKKILNPIQDLERDTHKVAEGDLSTQISYQSGSELGSLADSMRLTVRNLKYYIDEIQYQLDEISKGNLTVSPRTEFVGDFVAISDALQHIVASLNQTMCGIHKSSTSVALNTDQMSSSVQMLAEASTEEAQSMVSLSETVNSVSDQVQKTADNAAHADELVCRVSGQIEECGMKMQNMVRAMREISQKSEGIGKITKTIEDISFQTNILALNAAVEAARAGVHGKGFAVVADEVRALANKSNESVKNTADLVQGSIDAVKNGEAIVNETAELLHQIIEMAQQVTVAVAQITDATAQQNQEIGIIMQGIDQVTNVVQQNSATTEESAASSHELSNQADVLKRLVDQFHLKDC